MSNKFLFIILSVLILSACNQDDEIKVGKESQRYSTGHQYASGVVGKPHAPISMEYEYLNLPKLNEITGIRLKFSLQRASESLQVKYKTAAHLKSADASQRFVFNQLEKGEQTALQIQVIPEKPGLAYINVFAAIVVDGKRQSRSFAIPVETENSTVNTGNQKSKADSAIKHLPEQNVVSMPAVESSKVPATPEK